MCCESPREEGDIEFTVFQNSLIMELFFFFSIEYFMGLMLCKNTALVVAELAYFSCISHLFQPSIYFTLSSLLPLFCRLLLSPVPPSLFIILHSLPISPSFFLLSSPSPSNPHCLFSSSLLFTLFTLLLVLSLAFQEAQRIFHWLDLPGECPPWLSSIIPENKASDGAACSSQVWC